jgi:hypothetical protein
MYGFDENVKVPQRIYIVISDAKMAPIEPVRHVLGGEAKTRPGTH